MNSLTPIYSAKMFSAKFFSAAIFPQLLRALLALGLALQTISPDATQHWNAGHSAEEQKRLDVAVSEYRKVTELEPKFPPGFVSLGQVFIEQHDFASALPPLKRALELDRPASQSPYLDQKDREVCPDETR